MRHTLLLALLVAIAPARAADPQMPASVRVTFDRHGVTGEQAGGAADRATGRPATADTPVRIASISKLITALGLMRLVEAKRIDLDADVSGLLGFRVRNPAFPDMAITLRLLLSHRSSLTDGADYVLPLDATLRETLADPRAWDAAHAPGAWFNYTNLNFAMIAAAMEAATGQRFDRLMQAQLFAPLAIDACFNWSGCSDAAIGRAVVLYRANGDVGRDDLHGLRPACAVTPARDGSCDLGVWRAGANGAIFSPQGGVRISMRDLATIGRLLMGGGKLGGKRLLSARSVRLLRRVAWANDGANGDSEGGFYCAYGLAMQLLGERTPGCDGNPFGDRRRRYGHAGDAYGLKSGLWIDPARREGVAYFTTAVAEDAPRGASGWPVVEEQMARGQLP